MIFLQWQQLCSQTNPSTSVSQLKYIIQSDIANDATKAIVRQALGKPSTFTDWSQIEDGVSWTSGDDEFKAILASPNGRGAAWLLVQHKPQFGLMEVTKITVRGAKKETVEKGQTQTRWILVIIQEIGSVS